MAFWNRKKYRDLFDIYFVLSNNHISENDFINNYLESTKHTNTKFKWLFRTEKPAVNASLKLLYHSKVQ